MMFKPIISIVTATTAVLATGWNTVATARPQDFVGTWVNRNADTRGITRLEIQQVSRNQLSIQVFASCSPQDCDWGTTQLVTYGDNVQDRDHQVATARYDQGFKTSLLTLNLNDQDNQIALSNFSQFQDNSDRQNYFSRERFVKQTVASNPPRTYSTGLLEVPQTWTVDLDEGQLGAGSDSDIWFRAETATRRYVTPRNGAKLVPVGNRSVGRDGCAAASLSNNPIPIEALTPGTYVCVQTNQGRYSQFRVNAPVGASPGTLEMGYTTWEKPGD